MKKTNPKPCFFHETSCPLSYGRENLTDKNFFQFSIELDGQYHVYMVKLMAFNENSQE